ncbi:MAG: HPP family protein [Cocleimonas sp.]
MPQKNKLFNLLGVSQQQTSHTEKLLSILGGFIGIYAIFLVTNQFFEIADAIYIIPSMGATAVLLFAAPHTRFSQPWNVFGGHITSAIIGVGCYQLIPDIHIAAAASVGLATGTMYYLRCIHPPGGATALAAVIGGAHIHDLSYMYVITPVLINVTTILIIALIFNAPFKWRRYPPGLIPKLKTSSVYSPINHEDFVYALSQVDSLVDIREEDLQKIYALATGRKELHANQKTQ